jgi:hypothetical protein
MYRASPVIINPIVVVVMGNSKEFVSLKTHATGRFSSLGFNKTPDSFPLIKRRDGFIDVCWLTVFFLQGIDECECIAWQLSSKSDIPCG